MKETLTIDKIKVDLKKRYSRKITDFILTAALIPVGNIILVNLIILLFTPSVHFKVYFSCIYYIFFSVVMFYDLLNIIIGLISIHCSNINITSDWVINKETKHYSTRLNTPKPYTLVFAHGGKYGIPYGKNYRWSNLYSSTDKIIYESTSLNDEFYLISIKKQKNIMAYNKKHFDFIK